MVRDKKKIVLFILLAILTGLQAHRFWAGGSKGDELHSVKHRLTGTGTQVRSHDPLELRLDLLEPGETEAKTYLRDLFIFSDIAISEKRNKVPLSEPLIPVPAVVVKLPEPGVPDLELVGFLEQAGEKIAFFVKGQEILLLKINDQVEGRFKLTDIKEDWVIFRNLNTGKESQLKIVEMTPFAPVPPSSHSLSPQSSSIRATRFSRPEVVPDKRSNSEEEK